MSDSKVTQTFTTDESKLVAAYEKIARKQAELLDKTMRLARESLRQSAVADRGMRMQANSVSQGIGRIVRMTAAYASLQGAVSLVNSEFQKQFELQAKTATAQTSLANPRAALLQNLGDIPPRELRAVKRAIDDLAVRGLGERRVLTTSFGALASATPNLTNEERAKYLEVAAQFTPQAEELDKIAAGLGDVSGLTRSKNPLENLGVLASMVKRSRSTQPSMVAENIVPASKNLLAYGASVPEAIALPIAIQNETVDVEGRRSATASLQVGQQLEEFFKPETIRERIVKEVEHEGNLGDFERPNDEARQRVMDFMSAEGKRSRSFEDAFEQFKRAPDLQEKFFAAEIDRRRHGATKLDEYIHVLQRSPEEFAAFAAGFHGEEKQKGAVLRLLGDADSAIARQYEQFKSEGIPSGEAAAALGREQVALVQRDPNVAMQRAARAAENAADKAMTDNFRRGEEGTVRQGIRQALESVNTQTVEMRAFMDAYNLRLQRGEDPIEAGRALLRKRAEYLTDPTRREMQFYGSQQGYAPAPISESRQLGAEQLLRLDAELDEIKADLRAGQAEERPPAVLKVDDGRRAPTNAPALAPAPERPLVRREGLPRSDGEPPEAARSLAHGGRQRIEPGPLPESSAIAGRLGAPPETAPRQIFAMDDLPEAPPLPLDAFQQIVRSHRKDEPRFRDEYNLMATRERRPEILGRHVEDFSTLLAEAQAARDRALSPGAPLDEEGRVAGDATRPQTKQDQADAAALQAVVLELREVVRIGQQQLTEAKSARQEQAAATRQAGARSANRGGKE